MKKYIYAIVLSVCVSTVYSQTKENSYPSGKVTVKIFNNLHYIQQGDDLNVGFALDRSYFGYKFKLSDKLSGKLVFGIGTTKIEGSALERIAYVKNAMIKWQHNNFSLDAGLISLKQFGIQEKFWGYRYVYKSFQDHYKFGSSADLGVSAEYKFLPWMSMDFSFINGEGYQKLKVDNCFRYGLGATIKPIDPLTFRIYFDRYDNSYEDTIKNPQYTGVIFLGYKHDKFSIGGEFNIQRQRKFIEDYNCFGTSLYGSVPFGKGFKGYCRWDLLSEDKSAIKELTNTVILGFEYSPVKYLSLSPNFRWEKTENEDDIFSGYLSLQIAL